MKTGHLLFLGVLYCCINMVACKLDPPIMPGDKGYVATSENTIPGSKGSTGATGASGQTDTIAKPIPPPFTGAWFCKSTFAEVYSEANVLQSSAAADAFYYSITFDSVKNVGSFKLTPGNRPAPENYGYTLVKDNTGNKYILFDTDPFFRSGNKKIQVLNETPLTMTWLIIDPKLQRIGGINTYTAYRLNLIKIIKQ